MSKPLRVLLLEDSETDAILLHRILQKSEYDITLEREETATGMREALKQPWDIILSDHNMKGFDSMSALAILKDTGLDIPFIVISGAMGEELAVEAMRAGASDYLMKDRLTRLIPVIERELKEAAGRVIKRQTQENLNQTEQELETSNRLLKAYTRKLEQSNEELDRFATVVSHDLQAPLRKIMMFCNYLAETDSAGLSDQQKDFMERIHTSASRMQILIRDLLSLSRIKQADAPVQAVDLAKIVNTVIDDLQTQINAVQGRVELGTMQTFEGDPTQMRQMMQNLVENALKFRREDCPPIVKITCQALDSDFCQITVEDNGIGFKQEHAHVIFKVFQRLHSPQSYEGTGVGLAIVQKIVERHNGSIQAEGVLGEGSRFIITLPIHQTQTVAAIL